MKSLEQLAILAVAGDTDALDEVVAGVSERVYNLAIRMLGSPEDAEDATQEILIRVITRLDSFRGDSSLLTWVHRVASNHLLNTRARSAIERKRTFEAFGDEIDRGVDAFGKFEEVQSDQVLKNEIRNSCTHSMLLCLSNPCRCEKQGQVAIGVGALSRKQFRYANQRRSAGGLVGDEAREFTNLLDVAKVLESQPTYVAPQDLIATLKKIVSAS